MDDLVKAALKKWPNVPDCHGWLGLDARGDWYLRDEATQALGPFPQARGSRIEHEALRAFIERNYAGDDEGRWFFQNGPQRVYVELEAAPWVWRLAPVADEGDAPRVHSHSGAEARVDAAWLDEAGRLFLATSVGFGIVHSLDVALAAQAIETGRWAVPGELPFGEMQRRFGYCLSPAAARG